MAGTVLIVEDETRLARSMSCHLKRNGYLVGVCAVGKEVAAQLESLDPDIVLVNHELPDMDGLQVLRQIRASDSRAKVIMAIRAGDARVAEDAIQAGAHDYLNTPLVPGELQFLLDKVAGQARLESAYQYYQDREAAQSGLAKLIGQSSPMRALKDRIHRFLAAERTLGDGLPPAVLVTGATGTGKKLVARAFHFEGMRRDNPFVEINCASTPDHEMEAALFGFASGAVNDATQGKPGLVEAAQGGTLFVDEITAMETAVQAKLLTLLEDGKARRLGSARDRNADVRIIAASRRELERPVQSGRFRADLMFRLRIIQIHLPPLHERGDDVLLLAREFLAAQGLRKGKEPLRLTSAAELALLRYRWPGNVRELKNVIERSVLLTDGSVVDAQQLMLDPSFLGPDLPPSDAAADSRYQFNLERMERSMLSMALQRTNGNVTGAARLLGLSRDALRYRIAKYRLRPDQSPAVPAQREVRPDSGPAPRATDGQGV